ncbi:hypothetical protein UFOVP630_18 [uncultured Caudovirales phage]|uniref:Uncharacterized protein n=1 Tax=uncultured Caudovirales phage TaxID=2100421 RepID=A0A6J5NAJ2_9CAUD|nr:hypothetical protein UFOVP630_18 [uncultured Caudovirales phage]
MIVTNNTNNMTQKERNWMIEAIVKCIPLVVFQHEEDKLQMMMAKYVNPKTIITPNELKEDMTYIDKIYG